jgi:hypothetical protein
MKNENGDAGAVSKIYAVFIRYNLAVLTICRNFARKNVMFSTD